MVSLILVYHLLITVYANLGGQPKHTQIVPQNSVAEQPRPTKIFYKVYPPQHWMAGIPGYQQTLAINDRTHETCFSWCLRSHFRRPRSYTRSTNGSWSNPWLLKRMGFHVGLSLSLSMVWFTSPTRASQKPNPALILGVEEWSVWRFNRPPGASVQHVMSPILGFVSLLLLTWACAWCVVEGLPNSFHDRDFHSNQVILRSLSAYQLGFVMRSKRWCGNVNGHSWG